MTTHLTIFNEISIDGRIQGFIQDAVRYYTRALRWAPDAILMGSVTALNFGPPESIEDQAGELPAPDKFPIYPGFEELVSEPRPLLVVPDSGGRVRNWIHTLAEPWYRSVLVLVSETTPGEYLEYLRRRGIEYIGVGHDRIDLVAALELLNAEYGVNSIRTDCGGSLTGALLAAGLVDEIALLVNPAISGWPRAHGFVRLPYPLSDNGVQLELVDVERLEDGAIGLRYVPSR